MSEGTHGRGRGAVLGLAMAAMLGGSVQAAELLVIASTVPELPAGATTTTGTSLDVPRDSDLTLVAPSGGVLRIEGPWQGRIEAPAADEDAGLIGQLLSVFQAPEADTSLGAMRSFDDCEMVELGRTSNVCAPASGCIEIRTAGEVPRSLAALAPDGGEVELERAIGGEIWGWPRGTKLQAGDYLLTPAGESAQVLSVHLQPPLESEAHQIAWMSQAGCMSQAKAALAEIAR